MTTRLATCSAPWVLFSCCYGLVTATACLTHLGVYQGHHTGLVYACSQLQCLQTETLSNQISTTKCLHPQMCHISSDVFRSVPVVVLRFVDQLELCSQAVETHGDMTLNSGAHDVRSSRQCPSLWELLLGLSQSEMPLLICQLFRMVTTKQRCSTQVCNPPCSCAHRFNCLALVTIEPYTAWLQGQVMPQHVLNALTDKDESVI